MGEGLAGRIKAGGGSSVIAVLRADLRRCVIRTETLGLSVIAIYLQRALDELDAMQG